MCLHGFLFLILQRFSAQDNVQVLTRNRLAQLLAHLVLGQVGQQVADTHHRIIVFFTDADIQARAVLLHNHAVQRQFTRHPLVLLDTAVIMGIRQGKIPVFIQGILLQVQPRAVNMRTDNIHAFRQRLLSDMEGQHRLAHLVQINLIPGFQRLLLCNRLLQVDISRLLQSGNGVHHTFPFRLSGVDKCLIRLREIFQFLQFSFIIRFPCIGSFHGSLTLLTVVYLTTAFP